MQDIYSDKNSNPPQNRNTTDNRGLLHTEDGPPENDTSDKDDSPNETETLGENGNAKASSKRKGKRKRRNRSEKQKERVRQYKKKKRKEKIGFEDNANVNEVSGIIRTEAGSNMTQRSISGNLLLSNSVIRNSDQGSLLKSNKGMSWSDVGTWYPITFPITTGGLMPVTGEWYPRKVLDTVGIFIPNSERRQQQEIYTMDIHADSNMPSQSGTVSTLSASADIFVPRISKPANLIQKTELLSNLRASAAPFVPAAESNVESEPSIRASAEIFVPMKPTGHDKLEGSDSASSCSEDISKHTAAKPLEAHTATSATAISQLQSVKEPDDMEAFADLEVPFVKSPTAAVVSTDLNMPFVKAPTASVTPADSDAIALAGSDVPPSDIIVPLEDTFTENPEPQCVHNDSAILSQIMFDDAGNDEDDMFSILATYAESSLHCEFDEIVRKQTIEDDLGYTYFSIFNLLK